jgi:Protein of unknown function (DUF2878)
VKNLANFLLFQAGWFACVVAAAQGHMWLGPLAVVAVVGVHLLFVASAPGRGRELKYILVVGLMGSLADTGLSVLGATSYPTSEAPWPWTLVPPWIAALWVLFATLPNHSLAWLIGRPRLAFVFGAIGGPLSYLGGTRLDAVGLGDEPLLTVSALAIEYALVMPLLLHFARRSQ